MNNIKIENPYLGFIAIPLVIVVIVGFFLLPKYKRKSTKNLISLGMHFLMIVTLTLTFLDIQFIRNFSFLQIVPKVQDNRARNSTKPFKTSISREKKKVTRSVLSASAETPKNLSTSEEAIRKQAKSSMQRNIPNSIRPRPISSPLWIIPKISSTKKASNALSSSATEKRPMVLPSIPWKL